MHLNRKSRSLILSIALLASFFSVSGYAHNPAMHLNSPIELVVSDRPVTAYNVNSFNRECALQTKHFSIFTNFDFTIFLDTYNKACDVKFEVQNTTIINAVNCYQLNAFKLFHFSNTDNYHNIFIG
jgi:hypothetical protein